MPRASSWSVSQRAQTGFPRRRLTPLGFGGSAGLRKSGVAAGSTRSGWHTRREAPAIAGDSGAERQQADHLRCPGEGPVRATELRGGLQQLGERPVLPRRAKPSFPGRGPTPLGLYSVPPTLGEWLSSSAPREPRPRRLALTLWPYHFHHKVQQILIPFRRRQEPLADLDEQQRALFQFASCAQILF